MDSRTVTVEQAKTRKPDLYQIRCFLFMGPKGDGASGYSAWQDIDEKHVEMYQRRIAEDPNDCEIRALYLPTPNPEATEDSTDWKQIAQVQNAKLQAMLDTFGGLEKLQAALARAKGLNPEPLGYIDRKDIKRMSTYKATIWPGTNEIDAVPVFLSHETK